MRIEPINHFTEEDEWWECPLCGRIFDSEEEAYEHTASEWLWIADTLIKIGQMLNRLYKRKER